MKLFRRSSAAAPGQSVEAFWAWWTAEGASATARAIDDGSLQSWATVLSRQIDAVDRRLAWELGPGASSEHVLVVSAGGDPALRAAARRWRRGAPPADRTWEYSDVRLPLRRTDWTLGVEGHDLDAASVRVQVTSDGASLDVVLHHPAMRSMAEGVRDEAAFLLLDGALGEAAVETWIGGVESSAAAPTDAVDLARLRELVGELEAENTDEDGHPTWSMLEATANDGRVVLALAQVPLRPMTAPHLDTHVELTLAFADVLESGLPGESSLAALRRLEDHLRERLGDSGRVVAHETTGGARVLHLYVDGTTPAVDQVRAALGGWLESRPQVEVTADPAWDGVRHLRG